MKTGAGERNENIATVIEPGDDDSGRDESGGDTDNIDLLPGRHGYGLRVDRGEEINGWFLLHSGRRIGGGMPSKRTQRAACSHYGVAVLIRPLRDCPRRTLHSKLAFSPQRRVILKGLHASAGEAARNEPTRPAHRYLRRQWDRHRQGSLPHVAVTRQATSCSARSSSAWVWRQISPSCLRVGPEACLSAHSSVAPFAMGTARAKACGRLH